MFIIRNVNIGDLNDLYELSTYVQFINLPSNHEAIRQLIDSSVKSFQNPHKELEKNYYLFVLEDTSQRKVIGLSLIHALHGTPNEPHFYLKVGQEHKYSNTINTGFVHGTLKLGIETNGYTEIGALVLHPDYRNHKEKLGKQISYIRFLYLALFPERFTKTIHSELMPPLDQNGNSILWEALGRRFMNMNYDDADELSRKNKEFILSLFPSENIYQTLLSPEARMAIGKVSKETEPVKRMLEKIGFKYMNEVDPFDGGPHYRCLISEVSLVKNKRSGPIRFSNQISSEAQNILLAVPKSNHYFYVLKTKAIFKENNIIIPEEMDGMLQLDKDHLFGHTIPLD